LLPAQTTVLRNCQPKKLSYRFNMNTKTIVAVLLITLGIVVLAYSGITFTTPGKPVEFLGMHFETTVSHFIPPVVGALALVGGIVLLVVNPKRSDERSRSWCRHESKDIRNRSSQAAFRQVAGDRT